jgi:hypothetical protein
MKTQLLKMEQTHILCPLSTLPDLQFSKMGTTWTWEMDNGLLMFSKQIIISTT